MPSAASAGGSGSDSVPDGTSERSVTSYAWAAAQTICHDAMRPPSSSGQGSRGVRISAVRGTVERPLALTTAPPCWRLGGLTFPRPALGGARMNPDARVVVTGGSGFFGRHVMAELRARGYAGDLLPVERVRPHARA